jgi:hypothetical protein
MNYLPLLSGILAAADGRCARVRAGGATVSDGDRPNILVIWGDDIGITNLSCYSDGLMGYRTPNIDRIAAEGMRFTDSYGEQSCTAGRASEDVPVAVELGWRPDGVIRRHPPWRV